MDRIPETDWKYLRSIKAELIEVLCARINGEATRIATDTSLSQHERFLRLDRHLGNGNEIVAECFDDWRRSNMLINILVLRKHHLLTNEHVGRLSPEARESLELMREIL
jgi:hypothetical protein